jgi:hypothetical protein
MTSVAPNSLASAIRSGRAAEDDDLVGAEAPGGDHAAQADGAVTDDGRRVPGTDPGGDRRMLARPHHVREREERRHQRVVLANRQHDECSVRLRDTQRFRLCSVAVPVPEEPSVDARRVQTFVAEDASAVRVREWHDDEIADVHGADVGAGGLDDANGLVSHAAAGLAVFQRLVRPEIAAADGGASHADERVGRLDQAGIGDGFDADVAGAVHDGRAHG